MRYTQFAVDVRNGVRIAAGGSRQSLNRVDIGIRDSILRVILAGIVG